MNQNKKSNIETENRLIETEEPQRLDKENSAKLPRFAKKLYLAYFLSKNKGLNLQIYRKSNLFSINRNETIKNSQIK